MKKKGSGLEFILSEVEGLNLPCRQLAVGKDLRGIYPEPVEGIPNAAFKMRENLQRLLALAKISIAPPAYIKAHLFNKPK